MGAKGSPIKFKVNEQDLKVDIPLSKQRSKQILNTVVTDRVNELEKSFRERDELIQRMVESE